MIVPFIAPALLRVPDRKPTTSEPETLDSGHACIPVEEPKSARRELKQLLNYACLLFGINSDF